MNYKKIPLKEIRRQMSKPKASEKAPSLIFSNFVTPFSIKFFLYTGMTANQISLFNLFFVLVPASLIALGDYWLVILGCFLLQFHIILDYTDGAIARITKKASIFGQYYESLFHGHIPPILMFAISINSYRFFNNPLYLFLGGVTVFFMLFTQQLSLYKESFVLFYVLQNKKRVKKKQRKLKDFATISLLSKETKGINYYINSVIKIFNGFSYLMGVLLILAIFNVIQYAIIFYSLFYFLIAIAKFYIEIKKGFRDYEFR